VAHAKLRITMPPARCSVRINMLGTSALHGTTTVLCHSSSLVVQLLLSSCFSVVDSGHLQAQQYEFGADPANKIHKATAETRLASGKEAPSPVTA